MKLPSLERPKNSSVKVSADRDLLGSIANRKSEDAYAAALKARDAATFNDQHRLQQARRERRQQAMASL